MITSGPKAPATAADGGGAKPWSNVNNAKVEDGSVATSDVIGPGGGGGFPNQLKLSNFGFSIPSTATIEGIKLEAKVQSFATGVTDKNVHLETTGGVVTSIADTPDFGNFWSSSLLWITWGDETSLWGRTWTPAEINSSSFLASISGYPSTGTGTITVDAVRVTVYWYVLGNDPADVRQKHLYKSYSSSGQYLGNLPNVTSVFSFTDAINSVGSQTTIDVGVSIDTSILTNFYITDEAGNYITDENGNRLKTEGQVPILSRGDSGNDTLIKNGNRIIVWEYNKYYPNGKRMFSGRMKRVSGRTGKSNTIRIMAYSDSEDLDNTIARGSPFSYTADVSQTSQNTYFTVSNSPGYDKCGQTWRTGAAVTNLGQIKLLIDGTARVTVTVRPAANSPITLVTLSQNVANAGPQVTSFNLATLLTVSPSTDYFFEVSVDSGQSVNVYYSTADPYANGGLYIASYSGGSGGGSFGISSGNDLYFATGSGAATTLATYTSKDPNTEMLAPSMDDYISRGGKIVYTDDSIEAAGYSLTYKINSNTMLELIAACLTMSPNGFYYRVDVGENVLYMKRVSTTPDIVLVKGKHIQDFDFTLSIEQMTNLLLFTGGDTGGGSNLYRQYQSETSITQYGVGLDRKTDNRVTMSGTADAIGNNIIDELSVEQLDTPISIPYGVIDLSLLTPGTVIGFAGTGNFIDSMSARIVRREYMSTGVNIYIGAIPRGLNPQLEKISRELIAQQTIDNPPAPS